jgi:hypothetical protein
LILAVDYLQMWEREAAGDVQGGGVLRVFDEHINSLRDWEHQEVRVEGGQEEVAISPLVVGNELERRRVCSSPTRYSCSLAAS